MKNIHIYVIYTYTHPILLNVNTPLSHHCEVSTVPGSVWLAGPKYAGVESYSFVHFISLCGKHLILFVFSFLFVVSDGLYYGHFRGGEI